MRDACAVRCGGWRQQCLHRRQQERLGGGSPVQAGDLARRAAPQLQPEQPGEHLVEAEPRPCPVQRRHKRVRGLQVLQCPLGALVSGQQVRQFPVHPVEDGGAQQQQPHSVTLLFEHLGQQILSHRPFGAGEPGREPFRIWVTGRRQRGQPQPRRPPFGPLMQHRHRRPGQLHPRRREQLPRLRQAETAPTPCGQPQKMLLEPDRRLSPTEIFGPLFSFCYVRRVGLELTRVARSTNRSTPG